MISALRTLIVDDELPARTRLEQLATQSPCVELVGLCGDGREALTLIHDRRPQLLLLDVQMPVVDGFEVLRQVPTPLMPAVIFITSYDRYAVAAFEAHAVDYLLKPFSDRRFHEALDHAVQSVGLSAVRDRLLGIEGVLAERSAADTPSGTLQRIVVRTNERITLLNVDDIDWIGAAGVYVELHTRDTTFLYRSTLQNLLDRLDRRRFVRVHRSTIVNTDRVVELRPRGHGDYTVVLRGGAEVVLSRGHRLNLEEWLNQPLT